MTNGRRLAKEVIEDLGLQLVSMDQNGRNHLRAVVRTPKGNEFKTTFAQTPSDWRYLANQRSWMRRKVKELDEPAV